LVRPGEKDYISIPEMAATTLLTFLLNQESHTKAGARLSNLGTTDIPGWIIYCGGGRPVHYRMFSSIPGLYPLDASSSLQM